jgi:hypothetical protein
MRAEGEAGGKQQQADRLTEFSAHFPLVFLDPSGHVNLAWRVSADALREVRTPPGVRVVVVVVVVVGSG